MTKDALTLRVPPDLKRAMEAAAEKDYQPVSGWLRNIAVRELRSRGLLEEAAGR